MLNTILIVDDEENIRWVFKKALEKERFLVHTATSGEEALEKIRTQDYLMVFSDIFMDGITGLDLLKEVKTMDGQLLHMVNLMEKVMVIEIMNFY